MKVLIDSNVWISAILWDGVPDQILQLAEAKKVQIFASPPLLRELELTLNRPKFVSRLQTLDLTVDSVINAVQAIINFCPTIPLNVSELRDSKDTIILAAALSANANVIVTGDLDLLVLKEFKGVSILKPQEFLTRYFPN